MAGDPDTLGGKFPGEIGGDGMKRGLPYSLSSEEINSVEFNPGNNATSKVQLDLRAIGGGIYSGDLNGTNATTTATSFSSNAGSGVIQYPTASALTSIGYPGVLRASAWFSLDQPTTTTTIKPVLGGMGDTAYQLGAPGIFYSFSYNGAMVASGHTTTPSMLGTYTFTPSDTNVWLSASHSVMIGQWSVTGSFYDGTTFQNLSLGTGQGGTMMDCTLGIQTPDGGTPAASWYAYSIAAFVQYSMVNFTTMWDSITDTLIPE